MAFSKKQQEYLNCATHRWNIKSGATRSGKTYLDYFVIPKRLRAASGKDGLVIILGNTKGTLQRNIIEPLQKMWGEEYDLTEDPINKMMDMYVRMYDELKRTEGDNPTIGLVLCSETSEDMARYSVLHNNERLFQARYLTFLPTVDQLREEIEHQKRVFSLQQESGDSML